jgi:hypothetical protein
MSRWVITDCVLRMITGHASMAQSGKVPGYPGKSKGARRATALPYAEGDKKDKIFGLVAAIRLWCQVYALSNA